MRPQRSGQAAGLGNSWREPHPIPGRVGRSSGSKTPGRAKACGSGNFTGCKTPGSPLGMGGIVGTSAGFAGLWRGSRGLAADLPQVEGWGTFAYSTRHAGARDGLGTNATYNKIVSHLLFLCGMTSTLSLQVSFTTTISHCSAQQDESFRCPLSCCGHMARGSRSR